MTVPITSKSNPNNTKRKCDVLIISQFFPPDMGGGSARSYNVAYGLIKRGHKVTVISAYPHYPLGLKNKKLLKKTYMKENIEGITVYRVWIPPFYLDTVKKIILVNLTFCGTSLFPLLNGIKYDIVWAANPNLLSFFPAMIYGLINNKKIIRNVDDLWPEVFYDSGLIKGKITKTILDFITKITYEIPSAITPISSAYKREIIKKYKVNKNKFKIIEVGINKVPILPEVKKDKFIIMYSGILNNAYDFDLLIKAAKKLEKHEEIKFVIRGLGRREPYIKDLIHRYSCRNIIFSTDYLEKSVLQDLLAQADVFLLPMKGTRYTECGLPTKIFEYQSYGKPIISSSRGESGKYITKTKSGINIPIGDVEELVRTVLLLLKDKKLRDELGRNGKKYVEDNLTSKKLGKRMSDLIEILVENEK